MVKGKTGNLSRRLLVVAQFSCSIALIISTVIINRQIEYAQNRPTGYDLNRLMMTDIGNNDLGSSYRALKNDLIQQGIASSVSQSTSSSTDINAHTDIGFPNKSANETIEMGLVSVSEDYFKTMGMRIIAGRDFSSEDDTASAIFNEAAIRQMRLKQPLNQVINLYNTNLRIAGIAKDALMISPFSGADPTLFTIDRSQKNVMLYRLTPNIRTTDAISKLTAVFNKYSPRAAFTYAFSDESYAKKFNTEVLVEKLSGIFASLAIFISCLGLFGLATYVAEQRTKEIGIRKVLGATVPQVWMLLSRDFIFLVLLSSAIASGLAGYFLKDWLQQYAYRIHMTPGVFLAAALVALLLTIITVSFQAVKAGFANPVKSLRSQ